MLAAAVLWAAAGPGLGARERVPARPGAGSSVPESRSIILPPPRVEGPMSLETALLARRSLRSFAERELTWAEIGQLLWAAQGETAAGRRTAPSAGALYPLELYVATSQGLHRYEPPSHRLTTLAPEDRRPALRAACLDQPCAGTAPAVFVIAAVHARTAAKYGPRSPATCRSRPATRPRTCCSRRSPWASAGSRSAPSTTPLSARPRPPARARAAVRHPGGQRGRTTS